VLTYPYSLGIVITRAIAEIKVRVLIDFKATQYVVALHRTRGADGVSLCDNGELADQGAGLRLVVVATCTATRALIGCVEQHISVFS
jgi:hypothetical protein